MVSCAWYAFAMPGYASAMASSYVCIAASRPLDGRSGPPNAGGTKERRNFERPPRHLR